MYAECLSMNIVDRRYLIGNFPSETRGHLIVFPKVKGKGIDLLLIAYIPGALPLV